MPHHIKKAKGKDGYYVYGVDGKRYSKSPMTLEKAKKQMAALNIAHAKKEGKVISVPTKVRKSKVMISHVPVKNEVIKDTATHSAAEHPIVKKSKTIEKAVEVASMAGKQGMHSPAGVLAPSVSETTGGGSGLANDAHWVSSVKSGGRITRAEKTEKTEKAEKPEAKTEEKMTTKQKQVAYMEYYKEGKKSSEVPAHLKRGYTTYYNKMMAGKPPKWHKD